MVIAIGYTVLLFWCTYWAIEFWDRWERAEQDLDKAHEDWAEDVSAMRYGMTYWQAEAARLQDEMDALRYQTGISVEDTRPRALSMMG